MLMEPILSSEDELQKSDRVEVVAVDNFDNQSRSSSNYTIQAAAKFRRKLKQLEHELYTDAQLSFDYFTFTLLAALISGLGLVTNNAVVIVASMLISPLMNPIMATVMGTIVRSKSLIITGLIGEMVGMLLCIVVGLIVGVIVSPFSDDLGLPNEQMSSRNSLPGLLIGVLIAIPSGAGVALSVLGDNSASLVGVAISASLLPPAVNAGMMWGLSLFSFIEVRDSNIPVTSTENLSLPVQGLISLTLAFLNIICVYVFALLMFEFKRIAPVKGKGELFSHKNSSWILPDHNIDSGIHSDPDSMHSQG